MSQNNQLVTFSKPSDMAAYLDRCKGQISLALPKHMNPDRMLRLALTCFSTTPKLRECSAQSIVASVVVASQLGLEPGVNGQGYLIPYGSTCTFVPGWQGLCGLLNNSGRATAWTGAVFEGDIWDFQLGSAPRCVHVPGPNFGEEDKMTWVYACGKVNGSEQPVIEAWNMARVWKHRDRFNKVGQRHYSFQHPEMYARKVVLLQVLKYMPRSIELQNAIVAADAAEKGNTATVDEGIVVEVEAAPQVEEPTKRQRRQTQQEPPPEQPTERQQAEPESPSSGADQDGAQEPAELSSDPVALKQAAISRDLDENQVVTYLKKTHHCGVACKFISDIAQSGRDWLAANLDKVKDEIAAI